MSKMEQMDALYEKVSKDPGLQKKFLEIMQESKEVGTEATRDKLIRFAHDAGFDVDFNEMQQFLKDTIEGKEGQLSDAELDMVAGGKGEGTGIAVVGGVSSAVTAFLTFGLTLPSCIQQVTIGVMMEQMNNF